MNLKPAKISDLTPAQVQAIMERSMEDISSIYEDVRKIVADIRERGEDVTLEHYRKHKSDISTSDLEATADEIVRHTPGWIPRLLIV